MVKLSELNSRTAEVVRRCVFEQMASGNDMGNSSSIHGTGPIDTYDTQLGKKKRRAKKTAVIINPTQKQTQTANEVENE